MSWRGRAREVGARPRPLELERATPIRGRPFGQAQVWHTLLAARGLFLLRFNGLRFPAAGHGTSIANARVLEITPPAALRWHFR
jgi:hypothetical protein